MTSRMRPGSAMQPGWIAVCLIAASLFAGCKTSTTGHVGGACTPDDLDDFRFEFTSGGRLFHESLLGQTFTIEFEHLAGPDADPGNQQFEVNYGAGSRVDGKVELSSSPGASSASVVLSDMYAQGPNGGPSGGLPIDNTYTVTWEQCTFDDEKMTVSAGTLTVTSEPRVAK